MPLDQATALAAVDDWSAGLSAAWTPAEKNRAAQQIVILAARVVPHIVNDVALGADRVQSYLMGRTTQRLEDWLSGAAANLRAMLRLDDDAYRGRPNAIGLRSATVAEIVDLPGIGDALAGEIAAFVSRRPGLTDLDALTEIDGVGEHRLEQVRPLAYLDRPTVGLISPSVMSFAASPSVGSFLRVLDATDLVFSFGDAATLVRRLDNGLRTAFDRFFAFLQFASEQAARTGSSVDGALASDALRWLDRRQFRSDVLDAAQPARGGVLINAAYVDMARQSIDNAVDSVELMVFLGTTTPGDPLHPGPLTLVEAMEQAAARGVDVRVILDQDDGGEPYKSYFINKPLLERFKAGGVSVKFDKKDILLHSKVLVVDRASAIVGSHNWTRSGFNDTHELSVLIESAPVAAALHARFDGIWNELPVPD